jgi:hypothetical protein
MDLEKADDPFQTVTISSLGFGLVDNMFSILGKNSSTPAGLNFSDISPQIPVSTGSLANTANRWVWINPTTPNGILDTWNKKPLATRDMLVRHSRQASA